MTNDPLQVRTGRLFPLTGLLVALTLLVTACSVAAPSPSLPAPSFTPSQLPASETPTVPPPTPTSTSSPTTSPTFPDPTSYDWTPVASGLILPVDIQNAGDGSGRLFIVEKRGRILILQEGQLLPQPFLDIHSQIYSGGTEQGLIGLAFHPQYNQNGLFFVNYIDHNGNTVIARFHVLASEPNQADPSSETDLLHVQQPYANHNGGGLAFGPDGYLYAGLGDGGSRGDPLRNGQNLQTLLGKLLRIDVNSGSTYSVPPDNPFATGGGLPEVWAYGLRNPWRFSFDRLTGDLYIGDVGQATWEEVDFVPRGMPGGLNFGWSLYEGMHPYQDQPPANATFTWPVAEYSHAEGCSITGGYVYRGSALPEWQGVYLYGDYCSGTVWGLLRDGQGNWQSKMLFETGARITTFGVDEAGEIYLADYASDSILRLSRK